MSWNYRIIKTKYDLSFLKEIEAPLEEGESDECFNIYEVYYDDDDACEGGEKCQCPITAISADPAWLSGSSLEELKLELHSMLKAFDRPVLNYDDIEKLFEKK